MTCERMVLSVQERYIVLVRPLLERQLGMLWVTELVPLGIASWIARSPRGKGRLRERCKKGFQAHDEVGACRQHQTDPASLLAWPPAPLWV